MIHVEPPYRYCFRSEQSFNDFYSLAGEPMAGGERRFSRDGKTFQIMCQRGIGWRALLGSVLRGRLPALSLSRVWRVLLRLRRIDIATCKPVACGYRGLNPAARRSFILIELTAPGSSVTELLEPDASLRSSPPRRRALVNELAHIARRMHDHGISHGNFRLTELEQQSAASAPSRLSLRISGLSHARLHALTPYQAQINDIATLYASAARWRPSARDRLRFIANYQLTDARNSLIRDQKFWNDVKARADALQRQTPRQG